MQLPDSLRFIGATTIYSTLVLCSVITPKDVFTLGVTKDYAIEQRKELHIQKPTKPEEGQLLRYFSEYGSPLGNSEYISTLFHVAGSFRVNPLFIAAVSVLESSAGKHSIGRNHYGYCSGRPCNYFSTDIEALTAVSQTLSRYRDGGIVEIRDMASMWHTGTLTDASGYPERIEEIINSIQSH